MKDKDFFSELKDLGIKPEDELSFFQEKKEEEPVAKQDEKKALDILFDRKVECPVCSKNFTTRAVKSRKLRLKKTDLDLRPIYDSFDPMPYDVIMCSHCGYAALSKTFSSISPGRVQLFKDNVAVSFKGREYPDFYTYDIAIERYKMALYGAVVMRTRNIEKAYLCLKIAWLYRSNAESLSPSDTEKIKFFQQMEHEFMSKALEGFMTSHSNDYFPVMDFDKKTVEFLIGELSRRLGKYTDAIIWLHKILNSQGASKRLKDRASEANELARIAAKAEKAEKAEKADIE